MFIYKINDYIPKTGVFLGQLTSELKTAEEPDAYITKFISCGPKNYCYEVFYPISKTKKYFCKVKGLTLNFKTKYIVNFDTMKQHVDEFIKENTNNLTQDVPQMKFKVSKYSDIHTCYTTKKYRLVYEKRKVLTDYRTRPFGFKNST